MASEPQDSGSFDETIKEKELKKNIESCIKATMISEDGEEIELDVTEITLTPIERVSVFSAAPPITTYAATAKVKTSKGSYKKNGISANGVLTMNWTDVRGKKNKITRLKGYWSLAKGTFKSGKLYWGSDYTGPTFAPKKCSVGKDFDKSISYTSTAKTGKLKAHSIAYIKSPKNGKQYQFSICVSLTIFS